MVSVKNTALTTFSVKTSSAIRIIYFLTFEIFIEKIFIDKTKFHVTDELTDEITIIETIRR